MPRDELVMSDADIQAEMSADDPVEHDADGGGNPQLESDEDFSNWEDAAQNGEAAPAAAEAQPQTRTFKANGREIEVDMADQAGVDKLIQLGLGARPLFSQLDKVKKELAAAQAKLEGSGKYEKMWKKLDSMKGDHDGLYEAVFGRKYEDSYKERKEWQDKFEAASPEQQQLMLDRRKFEAERRELERAKAEREDIGKEADSRLEAAERKELRSLLLPEFHKHEFSSKIKDPARAEKLNAVLWRTTIANIKALGVEPTPELIRREFRATAALLAGDAAEAKEKVKQVVEEKKVTAKQQARVASTRNYAAPSDKDLSKEKDPVKLMRRMFGG